MEIHRDLRIGGGKVAFSIGLTTPACPVKRQIEEEASQQGGIPFLGEVPLDARIRISSDRGRPAALDGPDSLAGSAFHEVAARLAAQISIRNAARTGSPEPVVVMQ